MRLQIKNQCYYFLQFAQMGFCTKEAFFNICFDIDNTIDWRELVLLWDLDVLTLEMAAKMDHILETLKNE